jgi:3-isopropylmalate/(R)-2-methylmalate dehydratase small subunit
MRRNMKGRVVWKFGDNFNADLVPGSKNITVTDPEILGKVCLADYDPDFYKKIKPGDIVVAGKNFGFGHPHWQAVVALQKAGVSALVADSIYPMFYRVAVFYAFPVITCPGISDLVSVGDEIEINTITCVVENKSTGAVSKCEAIPGFIEEIIKAGGMVKYVKSKLST